MQNPNRDKPWTRVRDSDIFIHYKDKPNTRALRPAIDDNLPDAIKNHPLAARRFALKWYKLEFHTFDGGNSKSLGLLQLSGDVAGNRLTICKPQAKRPQFDLRKPASPTTPNNPNAS